jgi:hypothetical protein
MAGSQAAQAKIMVFHQLNPVFRLHAVEKSAVLETMESPGACGHLAYPLISRSGAQGSYDDSLLCWFPGGAIGIWFHSQFL